MSLDQGTESIAITTTERTWRVNIETPKGVDPIITGSRETVKMDGDRIISKTPVAMPVQRTFAEVKDQTVAVPNSDPPMTVTVDQISGMIADLIDRWRQEDIAVEAAKPALQPPPPRPPYPAPPT